MTDTEVLSIFDQTCRVMPLTPFEGDLRFEPWGLVEPDPKRIAAALRPSPQHADSTQIIHRADAQSVGGDLR